MSSSETWSTVALVILWSLGFTWMVRNIHYVIRDVLAHRRDRRQR